MKDFFRDLIWSIIHDEDTKIMFSMLFSGLAIGLALAKLLT